MVPAITVLTAHDSIAIEAYLEYCCCWTIAVRSSSVKPGGRGSLPGAHIGISQGRFAKRLLMKPSLRLFGVGSALYKET